MGFTETESVPGVEPEVGETESQLPPVWVVAAALNEMAELDELVTLTVWAAGVEPPPV